MVMRTVALLALVGLFAMLLSPVLTVRADNIINSVVVGVTDTTVLNDNSDSVVVGYEIKQTNDTTDPNGNPCNAGDSDGSPTLTINVPSGITASPPTLLFTRC